MPKTIQLCIYTLIPTIIGSHITNHLAVKEQLEIRNDTEKYKKDIDKINKWREECPIWKQWCTCPDIEFLVKNQ